MGIPLMNDAGFLWLFIKLRDEEILDNRVGAG
jgi:hypothetical protein